MSGNRSSRLNRLGDALEAAASADLASREKAVTSHGAAGRGFRAGRRRISRRVVIAAAALAIAVPGAAVAASSFLDSDDVAASLPAGTLALAGTEPTCSEVEAGVEYRCTLAKPPAPEVSNWKGTVEPTVDREHHVNGGCRSLSADGRTWECYLGEAAVTENIIGATMLGQYSGPSVG